MIAGRKIPDGALLGTALAALGVIAGGAILVATWHPMHLRSGRLGYTALLAVAFAAWLLALKVAGSVRPWAIVVFVLGTAAITIIGPPQHLTDIWNYLGYARLGAIHHLSPYSHVIANEAHDRVAHLTSWRNLSSPYGPLFTALTYPLALLPISVAYWALKVITVAAAVGTLAAVGWCAAVMGQDWRRPVVLMAANPIYLFFELNGFHNDSLMLLPSTLAVGLVISRRERAAGIAIATAIAIKFTAIVLLPFLLVYTFTRGRWGRVLVGAVGAAVPLVVMDVVLFGFSVPNLSGQSGLITGYSVPNLLGLGLGVGGATNGLERGLNALVVIVVLALLWRSRDGRHWISGAAWATLALTASIAWLMPWYLVWTLPLVALAETPWLRRVVAVATLFLLVTFAPYSDTLMAGVNPMATNVGRAAIAYQRRLQGLLPVPVVAPIGVPLPVAIAPEPRSTSALSESTRYAAVVRAPRRQ